METKPLKQNFYSRLTNGSLFTNIVQNTLLVTFTFAKYSSQNELFWTYKREGREPGAVTFYCKNSGRLCRSYVPRPKPMCFLFYSSIKWHLWINKISFKCWKPHTVGKQEFGDGSTHRHQQIPYCICRKTGIGVAAAAAKSLQLCPTLCAPTDGSPPGSPVPGIKARIKKKKSVGHTIINFIIK